MLYPESNNLRYGITLDGTWKFFADKEKVGKDKNFPLGITEKTRQIAVPASWNEQYNDLYDFHGCGWYETCFYVPKGYKEGRTVLRFGAVSTKCEVWVNGKFAMSHEGNALPFEADVTELLDLEGENLLVVLADSTLDPWGLPPSNIMVSEGRVGFTNSFPAVAYDFYPYGGIQRSVWLLSIPENHISDITVKTDIVGADGIIDFEVEANGDEVTLTVENITETVKIEKGIAKGSIKIPNARIWGIKKPELYNAVFTLYKEGTATDKYTLEVGIRTVKVEGDKFLLNGEPVFFKGFGKHEDFYVSGKGYNNSLTVKDFYLLNWIGANSFRTSHYPYDEQILTAADRAGILVIAETPFVSMNNRMFREDIKQKALSVIDEMITRDKNHPSIVMWSLANEPYCSTPESDDFFKAMAELARKLDNTRPITYVAHMEPKDNIPYKYYDVVCLNKYYGWYEGPGQIDLTLPEFVACIERFRKEFNKPFIMSEFGADCIAGLHTDPPQMFSEEYQTEMVMKQYEELLKLDYCIGAHIWAFADFRANQATTRVIVNRKGVFTREREPKMLAHALKKRWAEDGR